MSSANIHAEEIYYPDSDGQPMAETEVHIVLMLTLFARLRMHFKLRPDLYVIANMFLYYREGHPECRRAPDIMLIKGVDATVRRRSFKTWREGAVPTVVLELTSAETAREDQVDKMELYQQLGVREYFLFDPLGDYLPRQLIGYRLVDGRYEQLSPDEQESLVSEELGLRLVPDGTDLAVIDIESGERLPTPEDLSEMVAELREQAALMEKENRRLERAKKRADRELLKQQERARELEQRAEQEKQRAEQEKQRAKQEKQRAEQEKQRAEALADEVARLRALLEKPEN